MPYRIGFDETTEPWEFWFCFDVLIDIYFVSRATREMAGLRKQRDGRVARPKRWRAGRARR